MHSYHCFSSFYRAQCDLPGEDSGDGLPRRSLAVSSSETAPNPSLTQTGLGEVTSHPPPPASGAEEETNVSMAEVQTLVVEKNAEDQGEMFPSGHEDPELNRPASPVHVAQEPLDKQRMPPSTINRGWGAEDNASDARPWRGRADGAPAGDGGNFEQLLHSS